jgi:hypothetical protein
MRPGGGFEYFKCSSLCFLHGRESLLSLFVGLLLKPLVSLSLALSLLRQSLIERLLPLMLILVLRLRLRLLLVLIPVLTLVL